MAEVAVAEVVAVVRADTRELKRGMNDADATIKSGADKTVAGEKAKQKSMADTVFAIGRSKAAMVAFGAAGAGSLLGVLGTSKLLQTELGLLKEAVGFLADEIVIGIGADEGVSDLTDKVLDASDRLGELNEKGREFEARERESGPLGRLAADVTPDFISGGTAEATSSSIFGPSTFRQQAARDRAGLTSTEIALLEQALRLEQAAGAGLSFLITQSTPGVDIQLLLTRFFEMQVRATGGIS